MANRVNVSINVRDNSRRSLDDLQRRLRQLSLRQHRMTVTLNEERTAAGIRRINQRIDRLPQNVRVRVHLTEPGPGRMRRLGRSMTRSLTSPFRTMGSALGGIMSDGIGQGILNAFKTAGPVGMVILAGIIAGSVSLIAAALAGLLVVALGSAFVGLAAVSAAKSKEVQETWSGALKTLKREFKSVGEPLIPVLQNGIRLIERMAKKAAPVFRDAIVGATPALEEFFQKFASGLEKFGEAGFKKIMDSWNTFMPVFGEIWEEFMKDMGENFGELADTVRNHSTEIGMALQIIFKVLSGIIEIINFLAGTWIMVIRSMNSSISNLINFGLIPMAKIALNTFGAILSGAAKIADALGLPIANSLKKASRSFDQFKERTLKNLEETGKAAKNANKRLDELNKVRILRADIRSYMAKIADAKQRLKSVPKSKQSKLKADIRNLERNARKAIAMLFRIKSKKVFVNVGVSVSGAVNLARSVLRFAHGGVVGKSVGQAATGGVRNNMTMVGEQGPELVDLPTGSRVRSNPDTRRIMRGQNGGGRAVLEFKSSGRRADDLLLEILREAIHQRGGDPVVVLGG